MEELDGRGDTAGAQERCLVAGAQPHLVREGNPGLLLKTHGGTTPVDNGTFRRIMEPFGSERPPRITEGHCSSIIVKASTDPCPHVPHPHGF